MSDLKVLLGDRTEAALYKRLAGMQEQGLLIKVKRGLYATPNASLQAISQRIDPSAYISTGTILAREGWIGSVPARTLQAVKVGPPRRYTCALGTIEHLSIAPRFHSGYRMKNDGRVATPEKAFVDTCYYAQRGHVFPFDVASDVSLHDADLSLLRSYLTPYDPRFVRFVESLLEEAENG